MHSFCKFYRSGSLSAQAGYDLDSFVRPSHSFDSAAQEVCGFRTSATTGHRKGQHVVLHGTHEILLHFVLVVCGLRPTDLIDCRRLCDNLNHVPKSGQRCQVPTPQTVCGTVLREPKQAGNMLILVCWASIRVPVREAVSHMGINVTRAHVLKHSGRVRGKQHLCDSRLTALSGLVERRLKEAPARVSLVHHLVNSGFQRVRTEPYRGVNQKADQGSVVATPSQLHLQVLSSTRSGTRAHVADTPKHGWQSLAGKAKTAVHLEKIWQGGGARGSVVATPRLVAHFHASCAQNRNLQVDWSVDATPPACAPASAYCSKVGRLLRAMFLHEKGIEGLVDATPGLIAHTQASHTQLMHLQADRFVVTTPSARPQPQLNAKKQLGL